MRIKSILNKVTNYKGFFFDRVYLSEEKLIVTILPRKNSKGICSSCNKKGPTYDTKSARHFQFVPFWGFIVYFSYCMRRINCINCGVKVEAVPWGSGKKHLTKECAHFFSDWARRLSWSETAKIFKTSWHTVYRSVICIVEYGLENRSMDDVNAIGVDEIQVGNGHKYLTLVYQLNGNTKKLLYVGKDRTKKTLAIFFEMAGEKWCESIEFACTDMWKAFLTIIKHKLPNALNILDRFHIVKHLNDAVNDVRIKEVSEQKKKGNGDILKNTKYCLLKNPENLTEKQKLKLSDVLKYKLKSVRAYILKESFQLFWSYNSPYWARWYLDKWCNRAMKSQLDPIKKFVGTVRKHEDLIMNYFKAKKMFSSGAVEGLNRKVNLITRRAYGYKSLEVLKTALYHTMGDLPEPKRTHLF